MVCGKSITYPLKLIVEASLLEGRFPSCWKKANVLPLHKKEDETYLKTTELLVYFQFLEKYLREYISVVGHRCQSKK